MIRDAWIFFNLYFIIMSDVCIVNSANLDKSRFGYLITLDACGVCNLGLMPQLESNHYTEQIQ